MGEEVPARHRTPADSAATTHEPHQSQGQETQADLSPDLEVEPEQPAEDEEDVARMWEASDPIEGEAPTG